MEEKPRVLDGQLSIFDFLPEPETSEYSILTEIPGVARFPGDPWPPVVVAKPEENPRIEGEGAAK